ncbi:MAG: ATP-binding protein [Acidimicrobiales bacterium]
MLTPRTGPRVPAHQVTTRHLGAAYPLLTEAGLGYRGVLVGRDLLGGSFVHDPFELYAAGILSNPNMIVFGQIGRGKSAFVKTYLWRQAVFGRRAWVVDPKGEYRPLAAAWGTRPVALRPGGSVRLNPLDPGPAGEEEGDDVDGAPGMANRRQAEVLASLASACLGRQLLPRERTATDLALCAASAARGVPTLPQVVDALLDPSTESAASVRTDRSTLLEDGRDVALELRRLVHGDLRGMFDGPTTPGLDLAGPFVSLDLSALYSSPALGVLMACATAWLQATLARQASVPGAAHVFVVVDEAWAVLANLGVARWLQASWKLSRAYGVANVAVLHRVSDLQAVGTAGSEQVGLAKGLLADSETRVVYGQAPGEVTAARELLSLSETEAETVPQLRRGVALWKVGRRSFLVRHVLGRDERAIVDTDAAMTAQPPRRDHLGASRQLDTGTASPSSQLLSV